MACDRLEIIGAHLLKFGGPEFLWLFTIYKKFAENPVGKKMEHDLLGRSIGKFPGITNIDLKR